MTANPKSTLRREKSHKCFTISDEYCSMVLLTDLSEHAQVCFSKRILSSLCSLRSKRFRLVSEQRKTEERDSRFGRAKYETRATIFRVVFDSRSSFFAPKPHRNACYAGYSLCSGMQRLHFLPEKGDTDWYS